MNDNNNDKEKEIEIENGNKEELEIVTDDIKEMTFTKEVSENNDSEEIKEENNNKKQNKLILFLSDNYGYFSQFLYIEEKYELSKTNKKLLSLFLIELGHNFYLEKSQKLYLLETHLEKVSK